MDHDLIKRNKLVHMSRSMPAKITAGTVSALGVSSHLAVTNVCHPIIDIINLGTGLEMQNNQRCRKHKTWCFLIKIAGYTPVFTEVIVLFNTHLSN